MRLVFGITLAIVANVLVIIASPASAVAQKRIALLIGNKDYKPGVGAPVNPLNDVRVVGEALKAVGFELLQPTRNASRTTMLLAIHAFAARLKAAGPDAIGFLYYSGHGIASAGENYLMPVDIDEPSTILLSVQGLKHSEVLAILRTEAPNAAHYLVLDACRNTLQGTRGGKGFVPVGQQSGVLIAFAAEPGKTASDVGQGSGPYAAALAAELVRPDQSDLIMLHRVRVAVMDKTNGDQVPWTEDGIQRRDRVVFGGESKPATLPVPEMSKVAREWARVDKTSVAELESFVRRYPASPEADYARWRIDSLRQIAAATPPPRPPAPPKADPPQPAVVVPSVPVRCDGVEAQVGNERRCLKPKDSFKDCSECPEMVVVPAGEFMMGSPPTEKGRQKDEGPQHKVSITRPFAVGKYEVRFAEWDVCVAAGGCKYRPEASDRGKRPVTMVSWDDVTREYLPWLSRKSGRAYRLLTEAQWEYAARAGATTPFSTGGTITLEQANYDLKASANGFVVPVDSFSPNPWGLYQMHGNVSEWVEDCWHGNYQGALTDGSARTTGDCTQRVLRGGSWVDGPEGLRSARREHGTPRSRWPGRTSSWGFRLARTLD